MNLLIDFYNILHLQNILELLQYNDIFDNGRRIFMALLSGLRKVAPGAGGACLAIGAYFGCSVEKRASKQLKMVGWNSRCYCSYFWNRCNHFMVTSKC